MSRHWLLYCRIQARHKAAAALLLVVRCLVLFDDASRCEECFAQWTERVALSATRTLANLTSVLVLVLLLTNIFRRHVLGMVHEVCVRIACKCMVVSAHTHTLDPRERALTHSRRTSWCPGTEHHVLELQSPNLLFQIHDELLLPGDKAQCIGSVRSPASSFRRAQLTPCSLMHETYMRTQHSSRSVLDLRDAHRELERTDRLGAELRRRVHARDHQCLAVPTETVDQELMSHSLSVHCHDQGHMHSQQSLVAHTLSRTIVSFESRTGTNLARGFAFSAWMT